MLLSNMCLTALHPPPPTPITLISAFFGYKYVTSEQFKTKMMNKVLENVQGLMPNILDAEIPDVTGPSMQLPKLK